MPSQNYSHLIEINSDGLLVIYRIKENKKELYTSVQLPDENSLYNQQVLKEFCQKLGENIILDSPIARNLLHI